MWITKEQLNETRFPKKEIDEAYARIANYEPYDVFEEPDMVESEGVLMVDGLYLKALFDGVEDVYTSFIKTNKKVIDGDGGLTGMGLNIREYAKIFKNNKCEKFDSSVMIPYTTDDLSIVISHFLEVYPKEIIDFFDEKVFLTCSKVSNEEYDSEYLPKLSVPKSLDGIDSTGDYVVIYMMVSR